MQLMPILFVLLMAGVLSGCGGSGGSSQPGEVQSLLPSSERAERTAMGREVRRLLDAKQFDRLESVADSLRASHSRYPSGEAIDLAFCDEGFGAVDDPSQADQWARQLARLREWEDARPRSVIASIALAHALIARGRAARGGGYASSVSPEQWRRLESDLEEALAILRQCPAAAREMPAWYDAMMIALHAAGSGSDGDYRETYAIASRRFPDYARWYIGMSRHLMPRWYGSAGELQRFAESCATSLPDSMGDEVYARIAVDQCVMVQDVFQEYPGLSWPRIQHGLDLWERRWPTSLDPLSARARLACYAGDRAVARAAFERLGNRVDLDVWYNELNFLAARKWVSGDEPRQS